MTAKPASERIMTDIHMHLIPGVDDGALDVAAMVSWFDGYKGKSKTSCPNSSDWLEAFGDADEVYCVTITSGLSGSYNAACIAKKLYEAENPGKRVCVGFF